MIFRLAPFLTAAALALVPLPALAQAAPAEPPRLIVAISVDQLSADLFAQAGTRCSIGYRGKHHLK